MLKMIGLRSSSTEPAGMPSIATRPPWAMLAIMPRRASAEPDISSPTSKPSLMPSWRWTSPRSRWRGLTATLAPIRRRELEPVVVDVGHDHVAGAGVARNRGRHASDGAGAGHEHVLVQDGEAERGVHRVAERVEDRRGLLVHPGPVVPDVRHRQRHQLGKGAGPLDAEPDRVRAQVASAGHAVAAAPADDVPLAAHQVAHGEVAHVRPVTDHLTDELVPDHHRHRHRLLGPGVPAVDVQVGAADACLAHADQNVVDARLGCGHLLEPQPLAGVGLDQSLHLARCRPRLAQPARSDQAV